MLIFELEENTTHAVLNRDHYIGHDEKIVLKNMPLNDSEFLRGAYILRSCRSAYVSLINKGREVLRVYHGNYPAIASWRKTHAPFICIETVHGFDSDATDTEDLFAKKNNIFSSQKCIYKPFPLRFMPKSSAYWSRVSARMMLLRESISPLFAMLCLS